MKLFNEGRKTVAANIMSQWVVQAANYLVPLLVIPYVSRVLEPEMFGAAGYAQNIAAYLTFLVNFGFGISATQDVALNKDNPQKLSEIFSTVIGFKTLMLLLSFVVLLLLWVFMPRVQQNFTLFFVAALFNVGSVLFPYWFFQGMERMAKMSVFILAIRLLGLMLILLFVNQPGHVYRYLYALSFANIVVGVLAFVYVLKSYKLKFALAGNFYKSAVVRKSTPAFVNAFLVDCNTLVGMTFLGYYLTDYDLGIYSGMQKIMTAVLMVSIQSVTVAIFPRISRKFSQDRAAGQRYLLSVLVAVGGFAAVVSLALYFLSPVAVSLMLGPKYQAAVPILQYSASLPLLSAIATTLTMQGLFGMQLQRFAPMVGAAIFLSNVVLCAVFIPLWGMKGAALVWMLCQLVEIVADVVVIYANRRK